MSRFYASVTSDIRSRVTARGRESLEAHVCGWDTGVRVAARLRGGAEVFAVYATGGSNGSVSETLIGEYETGPEGRLVLR